MKPSVARMVHYHSRDSNQPMAAIITSVQERDPLSPDLLDSEGSYDVDLCVLPCGGLMFLMEVPFDAEGKPGCWRWPPRVG